MQEKRLGVNYGYEKDELGEKAQSNGLVVSSSGISTDFCVLLLPNGSGVDSFFQVWHGQYRTLGRYRKLHTHFER
jgi:hypothetical protein